MSQEAHEADAEDAVQAAQRRERERIVAYLAFHESSALDKARDADTEQSRTYQATIAKAMTAMREAIAGEFHWKAGL